MGMNILMTRLIPFGRLQKYFLLDQGKHLSSQNHSNSSSNQFTSIVRDSPRTVDPLEVIPLLAIVAGLQRGWRYQFALVLVYFVHRTYYSCKVSQ